MPHLSTTGSLMRSTAKENKPVWCSPGRPHSTLLRPGKGKALGELKSANRAPSFDIPGKLEKGLIHTGLKRGTRSQSLDGPGKAGKALIPAAKNAPEQKKGSPSHFKCRSGLNRAPSPAPALRVPSPVTSRLKTTRAPMTKETPPRTRAIKEPTANVVTPINRLRKPHPTASTPKGVDPKAATSRGATAKGTTPGSRGRERNQLTDETPPRKVRDGSRAGVAQQIPKSGSRDSRAHQQQVLYGYANSAAVRGRKASPTNARPPVKHLFLSPQVPKKAAKRDFARKSVENHGIWVGSNFQHKLDAPARRDVDSEVPPPAQPTSSPEITKRGSREASGEGTRGYFGAGHIVAPEGVGLVRDRRKCKPRGYLMIGREGRSMDSNNTGIVDASVQMPPPSVASVEWMLNAGEKEGESIDYFSHSIHEPLCNSLSEFTVRDNQVSESFKEDRTSEEDGCDECLEQLELSSPVDVYSQFAKRSQAILRHLRMRTASFSHIRDSSHYTREESLPSTDQSGFGYSDLECEDVTVDWREGLPSDDSVSMMENSSAAFQDPAGKNEELVRSSLSFTWSWVPNSENSRQSSGHPENWYDPDLPWYGFSPITPEFHKNSQLPDSGSKAIDALLADSVRRRVITDQSTPSNQLDMSCNSLTQSMHLVNPAESSSGLSFISSQETSSLFHFDRNSHASESGNDMVQMSLDNVMCQTSSPIEGSPYSGNTLCQNASPIEEVYNVACSIECSVTCDIDFTVGCSIDCTVTGSDDDEVEYASPTTGDYLSPVKRSYSPPLKSDNVGLCNEINVDARAMRCSSMSRTLEELMRHNFTL